MSSGCRVCREIEEAPVALLLAFIVLAWTPFWTKRMIRLVSEHDSAASSGIVEQLNKGDLDGSP